MNDVLLKLLELQEVDTRLREKKHRLEEIPDEIKSLDSMLVEERSRENQVKEQLKTAKVKRRETEVLIEQLESRLQKYQNQVLEVKTNEEYTALLHEIDGVKKDIREYEDEVLRYMETVEDAEREVVLVEKALSEANERFEANTRILDKEREQIQSEIAELEARRDSIAATIAGRPLQRYERVRAAIPVHPIVEVTEGGFCGGCFAQITLQRQAEIRNSSTLLSCENCGRIVYYKDMQKTVSP